MNIELLLNLSSRIFRVFRIFGKLAFVNRLRDFLINEGRRSRAETLEKATKAVLDIEKAEALRIKNSREFVELMRDAGFSEEQVQVALSDPEQTQRVSIALAKLLAYVDKGDVTLTVVSSPERKINLLTVSKIKPQSPPGPRYLRSKVVRKKKKIAGDDDKC
ncbi:MAG: hypothetical protein WA071_00725 [Undibacterium umbellatum]|uniref:hypothetical protein n=1 Tax=Undibacterium umbellatum TaxID=2762300 RepID=UPI003BB70BDD